MAKHEIRVYDAAGALQHVIANISKLNYAKAINTIGAMSLIFPKGNLDFEDFSTEYMLEIYRQYKGDMILQNETAYFLLDWELFKDGGVDMIKLMAKDAQFLLDTRIVAYYAGETESQKSDYADDMMKEVVYENMGAGADSDRQFSNFSIDADMSASEEIDKAFAWKRVYDVCREICNTAKDLGTATFFDIERSEPGAFTFRTYTDYRGANHGIGSGDIRFVGEDYSNLTNAKLGEYHSSEKNAIVVGGQGVEDARSTATYDPIESGYYRNIEIFVDARDESDADRLSDLSREAYEEHSFRRIISGDLIETPGLLYDVDFGFGDSLAVEAYGYRTSCIVKSVSVEVNEKNEEKRKIYLEGDVS